MFCYLCYSRLLQLNIAVFNSSPKQNSSWVIILPKGFFTDPMVTAKKSKFLMYSNRESPKIKRDSSNFYCFNN